MNGSNKRRVVVTGMGAVTPVGNNVNDMWESIVNGKNGIDFIKQFDASNMKVKIAAEVKNLNPDDYLEPRESRRLDRCMLFALVAATQAYDDSKLANAEFDHDRFGVFVTSGIGGLNTINDEAKKAHEKGGDRVSPFFIPNAIINLIGGNIAIKFKAKGPALPIVTACSAGTNAIGEAFRYIRDGYIDLAFAGGAEASINELGMGGFASMRALNFSNDPNTASIPFDKRRSGFVVGEGSGVLILEEYEHAVARGAHIYAEVVGYGTTCDAFHITAPDESADGITKCILNALKDAHIEPNAIDYINPHGTSTPYNDRFETLGIKRALGEHAYKVNISGTKSMTGHSLGAIGAIEAIISIKAINDGIVPPTINYQEPDEDCDLNYTPNIAVKRDIQYAMSNSLGFGGQNAVIILKKYTK
jgi:3-oxoacyl-[acyl-carrier-protein] synthase II